MGQEQLDTFVDDAVIGTDTGTGKDGGGGSRIRCPICAWEPAKDSRWICTCKHTWNTFDTGGVCPACLIQWTYTACLSCRSWSPHSDWYANL